MRISDWSSDVCSSDVVLEAVVSRQRLVGLGDDVVLFLIGGEPDDVVGDVAVADVAVRRLDEAERVDPGVGGEATDESDVRTLRGLDRAHAAVVGEVDVADLDAGPLTGKATGAERREATAVGEARQRLPLVPDMGELACSAERLACGDTGTGVK